MFSRRSMLPWMAALPLCALLSGPVWASASPGTTVRIPDLAWSRRNYVPSQNEDGDEIVVAELTGTFKRPGWALVWMERGESIALDPMTGRFTLSVPLTGDATAFTLSAIGSQGEHLTQRFEIAFPRSQWSAVLGARGPPERRYALTAGLGPTYIGYQETPSGIRLTQVGLTAKATALFRLIPKRLDVAANGFVTLAPVYVTPPTLPFARFYGFNGRVGITLPSRWLAGEWSLLGGWYFWGMGVSNNSYGISSLNGPQIFLSLRRFLQDGRAMSLYTKYAPMGDGSGVFGFSTFEAAAGGSVQLTRPGLPVSISLTGDLSYTNAVSVIDENASQMLTFSLGVQFGI